MLRVVKTQHSFLRTFLFKNKAQQCWHTSRLIEAQRVRVTSSFGQLAPSSQLWHSTSSTNPHYRYFSTSPILFNPSMTLETTLATLASCKVEPHGSLSHAATTTDPSTWQSAIQNAPSSNATVPSNYKLTKTLVFKPKTAKSATPTPLVLIACEDTDTRATNALGKQLNLKELRLATDDLINEFFGVDKSACESPQPPT
jgi:hypothetical protein